jgi:hypothetical protein
MPQALNIVFRNEPIMDETEKVRNWARNFLSNLYGYEQPASILEYETDLDSIILLMHASRK